MHVCHLSSVVLHLPNHMVEGALERQKRRLLLSVLGHRINHAINAVFVNSAAIRILSPVEFIPGDLKHFPADDLHSLLQQNLLGVDFQSDKVEAIP